MRGSRTVAFGAGSGLSLDERTRTPNRFHRELDRAGAMRLTSYATGAWGTPSFGEPPPILIRRADDSYGRSRRRTFLARRMGSGPFPLRSIPAAFDDHLRVGRAHAGSPSRTDRPLRLAPEVVRAWRGRRRARRRVVGRVPGRAPLGDGHPGGEPPALVAPAGCRRGDRVGVLPVRPGRGGGEQPAPRTDPRGRGGGLLADGAVDRAEHHRHAPLRRLGRARGPPCRWAGAWPTSLLAGSGSLRAIAGCSS